jgi:hypothetical protein
MDPECTCKRAEDPDCEYHGYRPAREDVDYDYEREVFGEE